MLDSSAKCCTEFDEEPEIDTPTFNKVLVFNKLHFTLTCCEKSTKPKFP